MEETSNNLFIPLIPFPLEGDLLSVITEVFGKAGIDMRRAVQAPLAAKEVASRDGRPSEEVILQRFIPHFLRTRMSMTQSVVFALHYPGDVPRFVQMMRYLKQELKDKYDIDKTARHVLLIKDGGVANAFMRDVYQLGYIEDGSRESVRSMDGLHKGARLTTLEFGKFFVVTWTPTIRNEELGRLLHAWLIQGIDYPLDRDRMSATPSQPIKAFAMPSARDLAKLKRRS